MTKILTKEEEVNIKRNFLNIRLGHRDCVRDAMIFLEENKELLPFEIKEFELVERALYHDIDKFSDELVLLYFNHHRARICFGEFLNADFIEKHYINNRHHLKYFKINKEEKITPVDICEACCDWFSLAYLRNKKAENCINFFNEKVKETIRDICSDEEINQFEIVLNLLQDFTNIKQPFEEDC